MVEEGDDRLSRHARRVREEFEHAGLSHELGWINQAQQIRSLPGFATFLDALADDPRTAVNGPEALGQLALSFAAAPVPPEDRDKLWRQFLGEASESNWEYVAIANLRYFDADASFIELPDGLRIEARSRQGLITSTGLSLAKLEASVGADWMATGGGAGHFVVTHSDSVPKAGSGYPSANSPAGTVAIQRLLQALRLNGEGDVTCGRLFQFAKRRFGILGGIMSSGVPLEGSFGPNMEFLAARDAPRVAALYGQLKGFEAAVSSSKGRVDALSIAISRFDSSYSRNTWSFADRLIDDMIGLEALLGDERAELGYSIAIRASGLLAANDAERVRLFAEFRGFYAARSHVVHGRKLSNTDASFIQREPELRDVLRRLVRGYLTLHETGVYGADKAFRDALDETLLDTRQREQLQNALRIGVTAPASQAAGGIVAQWTDQPRSQAIVFAGGEEVSDTRQPDER